MLMNLHKENDFRGVKASLIEVNRAAYAGGRVHRARRRAIQERLRNLIDHFSPVLWGTPSFVAISSSTASSQAQANSGPLFLYYKGRKQAAIQM
jgi:hypothetical protein